MERVQFEQEQMLDQLKDFVERGIFTEQEVKQIMQKRTAFETALVRRIPKKSDYLRYAAYEMELEALRRKRLMRIPRPQEPHEATVSTFVLVHRQFHILERAVKRFKTDVALWLQYIAVAQKWRARALVGSVTARALQLHPNVPALYIVAAAHELDHATPSAARILLQRGIRMNPDSVDLWREYVKMELGFVESLRRHWEALGIKIGEGVGKGKEKARERTAEMEGQGDEMGDGEAERMEAEAEDAGEDGEAARRAIMEGAIVKSIISSAAKALPKIELFTSLHETLVGYPCPPALRSALLDHLFALLETTLPADPAAIKLSTTRFLTQDLDGPELVEALGAANERLANAVREQGADAEGLAAVYAAFAQEWCEKAIDDSLKGYLITSLQLLAQRTHGAGSPALLAAAVTLLTSHHDTLSAHLPPTANTPAKILRLARKYTGREDAKSSAAVWLARLEAEKRFATNKQDVEAAWDEARGAVAGDGIEGIWVWGLDAGDSTAEGESSADVDRDAVKGEAERLERLLGDCKRIRDADAWRRVHETLLVRYAAVTHAELSGSVSAGPVSHTAPAPVTAAGTRKRKRGGSCEAGLGPGSRGAESAAAAEAVDARVARVRRIGTAYFPGARVWQAVFAQEAAAAEALGMCSRGPDLAAHARALREAYERWRGVDGAGATLAWARWLLAHGRAREATGVVVRARAGLAAAEAAEVERAWKKVVDGGPDEDDAACARFR